MGAIRGVEQWDVGLRVGKGITNSLNKIRFLVASNCQTRCLQQVFSFLKTSKKENEKKGTTPASTSFEVAVTLMSASHMNLLRKWMATSLYFSEKTRIQAYEAKNM